MRAGSEVEVKVEDGKIILSPARPRLSLAQLEKEQGALERKLGGSLADVDWVANRPHGREDL